MVAPLQEAVMTLAGLNRSVQVDNTNVVFGREQTAPYGAQKLARPMLLIAPRNVPCAKTRSNAQGRETAG